MNKKKIKIIISIVMLLIPISFLSGCVGPGSITTWGWDHINDEGTGARIWGHLVLGQNFHNWNAWFVYDTESHANWEDYANRVEADNYDEWNYFSASINSLDRATTYHYRAVGEYQGSGSTISVGGDATFIPGGPRVITINATDIQLTEVTLNGRLTHLGGAATCEAFFQYGEDQNNLNIETAHQSLTSISDFSETIMGLTSGKTYYYRAVAINDVDTWTGLVFQVTPGKPIVDTYLPTNVQTTSALYNGKLWHTGGPATCTVWFEYGDDNPNNLDENTTHQVLGTTGAFDAAAEGLKPATTYWVRAVANNGVCESKGEIKEFKTLSSLGNHDLLSKVTHQRITLKDRIKSLVNNVYNYYNDPNYSPFEALREQNNPMYERLLQQISIFS